MSSDLFNLWPTNYSFINQIYIIYMYEQDFVFKNIYKDLYAIKPNQPILQFS